MTDTVDEAQAREHLHRDKALQRRVPRPQIGTMHCFTCGEDIPAERRQALPSATHCFECQRRKERRQ